MERKSYAIIKNINRRVTARHNFRTMKEINEINLQDYIKEENNYIKQLNFSNQLANEIFKLNQISFFKRLILKLKMFFGLIKI